MTDQLDTLLGQDTAVQTLRRALATDRVPHAYLFDGPRGVGKEQAAFGLAQALVCERRAPGEERACGACSACVRALPKAPNDGGDRDAALPAHPDVVLLGRGLHDPQRIGRRTPETQELSVDQIRTLVLARSAFGPHENKAKVFIVRDAEELSISAANAVLKTLEEPGPKTHFVLVTSEPRLLLDTIRSRTQRVRFGSLPTTVVSLLLEKNGTTASDASVIAKESAGSMARARILADEELRAAEDSFVSTALAAWTDPGAGAALALAEEGKREKSGLDAKLAALGRALHREGTARARDAQDRGGILEAARFALVAEARRRLDGNASPQLVLEWLMLKGRDA